MNIIFEVQQVVSFNGNSLFTSFRVQSSFDINLSLNHRCPLCPYVTTSVNDFCKHVVLHAEARSDGPEAAQESASVTIQPAATPTSHSADKPQITIVASSGNAPGQGLTQFTANGQPQQTVQTTQYRCGM